MNDVQQTLLFPLMGRTDAAHRWPDLFPDPWVEHAMDIREVEESAAQQPDTSPATVYGLRHLLTIHEVNMYLKDHPGAAVVDTDYGLDRIIHEIIDADSLVYNVDSPEVIETHEHWVEPHAREIALPYSVTGHRWMGHIDTCKGLVTIAAGVFYYFEVDEVKAFVREVGARFPGNRLCYDAESPWVTAGSERNIRHNGTPDARMPLRVRDPFSVWTWSGRTDNVRVEFNFSSYLPAPERAKLPKGIRFAFGFFHVFERMYEVAITFK